MANQELVLDLAENEPLYYNGFVKLNVGETGLAVDITATNLNGSNDITGATIQTRYVGRDGTIITGSDVTITDAKNGRYTAKIPPALTEVSSLEGKPFVGQHIISRGEVVDILSPFLVLVNPTAGIVEKYGNTIDEIDVLIKSGLAQIGATIDQVKQQSADLDAQMVSTQKAIDTQLTDMANKVGKIYDQAKAVLDDIQQNPDKYRGPQGKAATIKIGKVTLGDTPSVVNVGTDEDVVLNMTLVKGDKGEKGDQGDKGDIGPQGKSVYEVAVENGFEGTREEWLEEIQAVKGDPGPIGQQGPQGDVGPQGPQGAQGPIGPKGDKGNSIPNYVDKPDFEDGLTGTWGPDATIVDVPKQLFTKALKTVRRDTTESAKFPVSPGETWTGVADLNAENSKYTVLFGMFFYDATGRIIGFIKFNNTVVEAGKSGWQHVSGTLTTPYNAWYGTPWIQISGSDGSDLGYALATNLFVTRLLNASQNITNKEYASPVNVTSAVDFNAQRSVGIYLLSNTAGFTNAPIAVTGRLEVRAVNGTTLYQTYRTTDNVIYSRMQDTDGAWSAWSQGATPNPEYGVLTTKSGPDFNSIVDVGNYNITNNNYSKNGPESQGWGRLEVRQVSTVNTLGQTFIDDSNRSYRRTRSSSGSWTAWIKDTDSRDLATAKTNAETYTNQAVAGLITSDQAKGLINDQIVDVARAMPINRSVFDALTNKDPKIFYIIKEGA
ncbi:pyocin knob domain-containing protein [Lacticaseibacillus brantae]|uniref:BppU N-terminal domain-containing protein n=1 Tax=Lacticaseibacillus brantae DSM 23927 TaxID=1423727 RepID=A0A0R2B9B0_9LACO|nr:pyocin knob domain-containing protein [Lacticaseibacillus brantae]KRM73001.1 hypothetical protein FC34_GL000720 [Lacticaseibacillus brantae DSM 23927]